MECKKCGNTLGEKELFCKKCGYLAPYEEQKERVEEAKASIGTLILEKCKSPLFLVFTICLSIIALTNLVAISQGDFSPLIPTIFLIISTVGLWSSYTAKDATKLSSTLKNASIYDAYVRFTYTVSLVFAIIFTAGLIALVFLSKDIVSSFFTNEADAQNVINIVAIIIGVIALIAISIILLYRGVYAGRRKYFLALATTVDTKLYDKKKAPVVGSSVVGAFSLVGGVSTLTTASMVSSLVTQIVELVGGMLGEYADLFAGIPALVTTNMIFTGIFNIAVGLYYILSGVWMSDVHKALVTKRGEIEADVDLMYKLEAQGKEQHSIYERERQDALIAASASLETSPELQAYSESSPAEETPAEETPAEETPAEETPAEEATV